MYIFNNLEKDKEDKTLSEDFDENQLNDDTSSDNNSNASEDDEIFDEIESNLDDKLEEYYKNREENNIDDSIQKELQESSNFSKRNLIFLSLAVLLFIFLIYYFFASSKNKNDISKNTSNQNAVTSASNNDDGDIENSDNFFSNKDGVLKPIADNDIPSLPGLPNFNNNQKQNNQNKAQIPEFNSFNQNNKNDKKNDLASSKKTNEDTKRKLPELPSSSNISSNANIALPSNREDLEKRKIAKMKSSIMLINGKPPAKSKEQIEEEKNFTYLGDMHLVLGKGKIIDVVTESAISTDFGGEIKAIVARDVFSEHGRNVLIPKGSKIFGIYGTSVDTLRGRVNIMWNRISLPNGYIINLNAIAIDDLNRKGIRGRLDLKMKEQIANAVFRSMINIGIARGLDKIVTPRESSQKVAKLEAEAANIRNTTTSASASVIPTTNYTGRIEAICTKVINAIDSDQSTVSKDVSNACAIARAETTPTEQTITSLINAINIAADKLIKTSASSVVKTQAQAASEQAYKDITETIKKPLDAIEYKPTITIDHGTKMKIYITKDYKFPKKAIAKRIY